MRGRGFSSRGWSLVGAMLALTACSGPQVYHQPALHPHSRAAAAPARPTPARPTPTAKPLTVNPLTGLKPVPTGRVFAVKIDDTPAGRPQTNINDADVVYVEQVEGGLTRLAALYASRLPATVGPVRSVRLDDAQLLGAYGRLAVAFSGGASGVVAAVDRSSLVNASADNYFSDYSRSAAKPMPYNLMVDLPRLSADLRRATSSVRDVGFRWSSAVPAGGRTAHQIRATVGGTAVDFAWQNGHWIRKIDGVTVRQSNGAAVSTPNVIVQFCKVAVDPRDVDTAGNPSANTTTVGSGKALIFRDGRVFSGRWVRHSTGSPTRFVDAAGHDIPLHTGGTWVVLATQGSTVHTT
jgi:DUF3048 family protein